MQLQDHAPYLGRSYDGREKTVVELQFENSADRMLLIAELPGGEQCKATFHLIGESRPLGFLIPPHRDYGGRFDDGLSAPCMNWLGAEKDRELRLRLTYHPMTRRYFAGITRYEDATRVAGDWFVFRPEPLPQ